MYFVLKVHPLSTECNNFMQVILPPYIQPKYVVVYYTVY